MTGTDRLNGQPLEFGTVMFQPARGQPGRGKIQPDVSFTIATFKDGDGATVGPNGVRITCYESQRRPASGEGEQSLGKSLIPQRYTLFDQSGLTANVQESENEPFVFELQSAPAVQVSDR